MRAPTNDELGDSGVFEPHSGRGGALSGLNVKGEPKKGAGGDEGHCVAGQPGKAQGGLHLWCVLICHEHSP